MIPFPCLDSVTTTQPYFESSLDTSTSTRQSNTILLTTTMYFTTSFVVLFATLALAAPSPVAEDQSVNDILARHLLTARNCDCWDNCSKKCGSGGCHTPGCNGGALLGW